MHGNLNYSNLSGTTATCVVIILHHTTRRCARLGIWQHRDATHVRAYPPLIGLWCTPWPDAHARSVTTTPRAAPATVGRRCRGPWPAVRASSRRLRALMHGMHLLSDSRTGAACSVRASPREPPKPLPQEVTSRKRGNGLSL
jgi:hypothetical protein